MDRKAIARAERRRQALEALEFERARAAALRERLGSVVAELDGPALDEAVFAQLAPEDVALVRPALQSDADDPVHELEVELEDARAERTAWLEEEIVRLGEEIVGSGDRQLAFERYLEALGSGSSGFRTPPAGDD